MVMEWTSRARFFKSRPITRFTVPVRAVSPMPAPSSEGPCAWAMEWAERQMMSTPAMITKPPSSPAEMNSTLPCPYGCSRSRGFAVRIKLYSAKAPATMFTTLSKASPRMVLLPVMCHARSFTPISATPTVSTQVCRVTALFEGRDGAPMDGALVFRAGSPCRRADQPDVAEHAS